MGYDDVLLDAEEKMEKSIEVLQQEFRGMRTGRANPGLIDSIKVDYYGQPTPLKKLANIGVPEPQLLVVKAFDPKSLGDIEKAILRSDVGITPQNDGKVIRLAIPPLSEERRKKLVARAKEVAEQTRVALRNVRRDAKKDAAGLEADGLPQDQTDKLLEEIQNLLKQYEGKVDEILAAKTKELMEI